MTAIGNPRLALETCIDLLRCIPSTATSAVALKHAEDALRGHPYPAASLETAACLWEAVLEMEAIGEMVGTGDEAQETRGAMIRAARAEMGSSALRMTVLGWVDDVDAAWAATDTIGGTDGHYDRTFDWDFVPEWIAANIDWSNPHAPTRRRPSPLDALAPDLRAWLVDDLGMRAEIMGGGAFGLQSDGPAGSYVLVTCLDGGGMPTADSWHVGAYLPDGAGDAIMQLRSDHEGQAGATLTMAVAAARGVLADYDPAAHAVAAAASLEQVTPDDNRFRLAIAAAAAHFEASGNSEHAKALHAMLLQAGTEHLDPLADTLTDLISIIIDG